MTIEFRRQAAIEGEGGEPAARLAKSAFEDFYGLFTRDEARLLPAIATQFESHSELDQAIAAFEEGTLEGIACFYEVAQMPARQMESLRMLLDVADDAAASVAAVRAFARNFAPPPGPGIYLSRFVVAPGKRGGGLAAALLGEVESECRRRGLPDLYLHVRRDNARAIAFTRGADSLRTPARTFLRAAPQESAGGGVKPRPGANDRASS